MTEEEKTLKYLSAMRIIDFNKLGFAYGKETIDKVLNLTQKQEKQIDLMEKEISDFNHLAICEDCEKICEDDYDYTDCNKCIKQYFESKV